MVINLRTITLASLAVLICATGTALAFHDAGTGHCDGCHTMHNSQDDAAQNFNAAGDGPGTPVGTGYNNLLLFANTSDVCLNCHAGDNGSYDVWATSAMAPNPQRGGGDFVFLEEDNINDGHAGATNPIPGHAAGHSIVSAMMGTVVDPALGTAPGGAFSAADLGCVSCHDPHGNDSYRLTYRDGQTANGINWTATIDADPIALFGPAESDTHHNAYKSGYSAWCSTCHGDFHLASASLIHPSGEFLASTQVEIYNSYNGTSDCVTNPPNGAPACGSGTYASAYLAAVPLEDPSSTTAMATGALDGSSRVACVSCHRAHASSAPDSGRWDFNITFLSEDGVESDSFSIASPYDDLNQRSLCNKCHAQDEYDALPEGLPEVPDDDDHFGRG